MKEKVLKLLERLEEVEALLGKSETLSDQKLYKELSREHSYLSDIKEAWTLFEQQERGIEDNRTLIKEETDGDLLQMIREDLASLESEHVKTERALKSLLVPPDPRDSQNTIVELRAGTGGDEAAIFVGDCVRMYKLFADKMGWKSELLSCTPSDMGGFKEYVMAVSGKNVFRMMKYEAGTHRVQRVPQTETQGRVHTSAITVAVLLEPLEDEKIDLQEKDLRIDTYRSSGAGGQHVNTTDSAVRITHIPTGTVVCCQEERSQHKNKDKALRLLSAKVAEKKREDEQKERAEERALQVGTGDRSERIRTYNFSQNRVSDHRIDLTLYKLDQVMEGDLGEVTEALVNHYYQQQLTS